MLKDTNVVKIAIVEDHLLVRQTFKDHINQYSDLNVVMDVDDGGQLLKALEKKFIEIDVALLDLFSPQMDGRETLKRILRLYPSIHPLILSACTDQSIINSTFDLGSYGFISKNSESEELYKAILSAAGGKVYRNKFYFFRQALNFSPIEIRVLELIWQEKTNEEIARIMCLSISAIEKIKHQLKEKSNTKTTVGLIRYALEKRILIHG
ncbi:MAG: response regulator transcription factor [Agriterribacter sp.]